MFSILRCCQTKVHTSLATKVLYRRYMKVSDKMEELLKKNDHVPFSYSLIYREKKYLSCGIMYHAVNFMTCTTLIAITYFWYNKDSENIRKMNNKYKPPSEPWQLCIVILFSIGIFVIAQAMRKRYPIRIYFSEKDKMYRAIFLGKVPFTTEFYDFPQHTLTHPSKKSSLPWQSVFYDANGRKIMLLDEKFKTYQHFYDMFKSEKI